MLENLIANDFLQILSTPQISWLLYESIIDENATLFRITSHELVRRDTAATIDDRIDEAFLFREREKNAAGVHYDRGLNFRSAFADTFATTLYELRKAHPFFLCLSTHIRKSKSRGGYFTFKQLRKLRKESVESALDNYCRILSVSDLADMTPGTWTALIDYVIAKGDHATAERKIPQYEYENDDVCYFNASLQDSRDDEIKAMDIIRELLNPQIYSLEKDAVLLNKMNPFVRMGLGIYSCGEEE